MYLPHLVYLEAQVKRFICQVPACSALLISIGKHTEKNESAHWIQHFPEKIRIVPTLTDNFGTYHSNSTVKLEKLHKHFRLCRYHSVWNHFFLGYIFFFFYYMHFIGVDRLFVTLLVQVSVMWLFTLWSTNQSFFLNGNEKPI